VIEEAPAPGMDEATREEICAAAVRAAKAVDYEGAGTIEFIADASEGLRATHIFFMEMNTRLQVEHPVTEVITGVDLVEWQLLVAAGEPIPCKQEDLSIDGHAIEARLYAEDPSSGFLPSPGRIDDLELDHRIRIETGVEESDTVSAFYDPMIAKMVVHAGDREEAIDKLLGALNASYVSPLKTNQGFLYECLALKEFRSAELDTGLIERKGDELMSAIEPSQAAIDAAARRYRREDPEWMGELFSRDPALQTSIFGFRLNASPNTKINLHSKGKSVVGDASNHDRDFGICTTMPTDEDVFATERGQTYHFTIRGPDGTGAASAADGAILAPMPGKVIALDVAEGDSVTAGQRLMVLEAMKMEHSLTAPFDGTVTQLSASEGGQVQVEAVLCVVEPAAD
jgi:3-methylcrotonyl-CoA carboxylase alpha subunit